MSQMVSGSPSSSTPVVDYSAHPKPLRGSWLNVRMLIFAVVICSVIGYPVYIYLQDSLTQGIIHHADGYTEVNLKAMSLFPFDQQSGKAEDIPQRFRDLSGQKVELIGEMWAPDAAGPAVDHFDLVYSIAKCCFSGPAQVQHFVKSTAVGKEPLPFYSGQVKVKGTLKVEVTYDQGKVASVYHVAVDSVDPL